MKPRYLQSPNQAHPRVTPTSSSASAGGVAGRFGGGGKGQQGQMDLVYERENLNPEDVHMSLRLVRTVRCRTSFKTDLRWRNSVSDMKVKLSREVSME